MRRLFYILVWSIIGWVGGGCVHVNLTRLADNHKTQPWVATGRQAKGLIVVRLAMGDVDSWVEWSLPSGRSIDSRKVTERLERACGGVA